MNNAYIAGFFDGEGCIFIHRQRKPGKPMAHTLRIMVGQKNPEALERMQEWSGLGKVIFARNQPLYYWRIGNLEDMKSFIDRVYRHSIVKRLQLDIAREFLRLPKWKRGLSDEKEKLACRMQELKRL